MKLVLQEMSCDEESGIRWRRNSWSSLPRVDERLSIDECAIGGAPLTLDLTDKVKIIFASNEIAVINTITLIFRSSLVCHLIL